MTILTFFDPSFWLYFILFWISIFFAFFIPGDLVLRKLRLTSLSRLVLATLVGMVLWGWQGFIFGYLEVRWLSYVYLLVFFILWFKTESKNLNFKFNMDLILSIIITIGVLLQLSTVWFTGIFYSDGLFFCCGHLADSVLHLALTNQLVKQFPPYEPGMYGTFVQNYHYWGNLVVSELIRVFHLPLINTQYQYFSLFISLFLGLSAIAFSQLIKIGINFTRWLTFFLYFGGDTIFLLLLIIGRGFNFSMGALEDGSKFLVNPPRAFAVVVFFAGLGLLILWLRRRDLYSGLIMAIILGSLVGFKIYIGIFALIGLAALGGYYLLKKNFRMILPLIVALIIALVIYLPVNSNAGGLYFTGLWRFENFIVQPALGFIRLELARIVFLEHQNWLRVAQYELIFIFVYLLATFGSKLVGIIQTKKSLSLFHPELNIFLMSGIAVSALLGFFFQQNTGEANTFNFLVSIFIIGSIYTALAGYYWMTKMKNMLKLIFVFVIMLLTIPRVFHEGYLNMTRILTREGFLIENNELEGLNFVKSKTGEKSLILVDNRKFNLDLEAPYISFLADRPMFLSGINNELKTHGINFSDRELVRDVVLKNSNICEVGSALFENKVDYIYMSPLDDLKATESAYFTQVVFENPRVKILKVSGESLVEYMRNNNLPLQREDCSG